MKKQSSSGASSASGLPRRDFLKLTSAATGGLAFTGMPVMAGPFTDNPYLRVIPADKKLRPEWVRSLFARGEKPACSDPVALDHLGMPVGGFFAGTVYLAGDGRLWLWDVFNGDPFGILPRTVQPPGGFHGNFRSGGLNYLFPAPLTQPFRQGFRLRVAGRERPLDRTGFRRVTFEGRYPLGRVTYRDPDCPVEVRLEAFSPFIPLNLDDSSLPATVMSFRLTNRADQPVEATLTGELENAVCLHSRANRAGRARNRITREDDWTALVCSAEAAAVEAARPDIVFEDFEKATYAGWQVEGEAFGAGPVERDRIPDYQGDVNLVDPGLFNGGFKDGRHLDLFDAQRRLHQHAQYKHHRRCKQ